MTIYKAILKYSYKKFKLEILEYCDSNVVLLREQYYIDMLKPKYNILSTADSILGCKHTSDTLDKLSSRVFTDKARANLIKAATDRILSKETWVKVFLARLWKSHSQETRAKLSLIPAERQGIKVKVIKIISKYIK